MKKFIKQLDEEQLKTLIVLGLAECDRNNDFERKYLHGFGVNIFDNLGLIIKEHNDSFYVSVLNLRYKCSIANFSINDFSMIIHDGGWSKDLNSILKIYLVSQFEEDYLSYLYTKRMNEAEEERKMLYNESLKVFENYYPHYLLKEKEEKAPKVKTIGTVNVNNEY